MEGEFHHTDKGITMINEAIAQATAAHAPPADLAGMLGARVVMFGYKGDYARAMADCDQALRLATEANSPPAAMGCSHDPHQHLPASGPTGPIPPLPRPGPEVGGRQ